MKSVIDRRVWSCVRVYWRDVRHFSRQGSSAGYIFCLVFHSSQSLVL